MTAIKINITSPVIHDAALQRLRQHNITDNETLHRTDLTTIRNLFRPDIPEENLVYQAISTSRQSAPQTQHCTARDEYNIPRAQLRYPEHAMKRLRQHSTHTTHLNEDIIHKCYPNRNTDPDEKHDHDTLLRHITPGQRTSPSTTSDTTPAQLPSDRWAIEIVSDPASRHYANGWTVAEAITEVFEEELVISRRQRNNESPWRCASFQQRCNQAGLGFLAINTAKIARQDHGMRPAQAINKAREANITSSASFSSLAYEAAARTFLHKNAGSWTSLRSGIRAYAAWSDTLDKDAPHFPSPTSTLVTFTTIFRNGGTLNNYLGYVKTAHHLLHYPTHHIDNGTMKGIKCGSKHLTTYETKPRIRRDTLQRIHQQAELQHDYENADIYAISYHFMLRVQSECFPLQRQRVTGSQANEHSDVHIDTRDGNTWGVIHIQKRKNTRTPTIIQRQCRCDGNPRQAYLCGVCAIQRRLASHSNTRLFSITVQQATAKLREHLTTARPPNTTSMSWQIHASWHAFRRGAASDALRDGDSIGNILASGGWKSSAILRYLVADEIDQRLAAASVIEASDSDN